MVPRLHKMYDGRISRADAEGEQPNEEEPTRGIKGVMGNSRQTKHDKGTEHHDSHAELRDELEQTSRNQHVDMLDERHLQHWPARNKTLLHAKDSIRK